MIQKQIKFPNGKERFRSPYVDLRLKEKDRNYKQFVGDLSGTNPKYYDLSSIQTEKQLCEFIYDMFGAGYYLVLAFQKGIFVFWRGSVDKDGFCFEKRDIRQNKEYAGLKKEEGESWVSEAVAFLRKEHKEKRYGFYNNLRPSGKRGTFVSWNEEYFEQGTSPMEDAWHNQEPVKEKEERWI